MATRRSLSLEAARGGSDSWTQQVIRFYARPRHSQRNRVAPLADALAQDGASPAASLTPLAVRRTYPSFRALTCVHVNCDDTRLLACGYSNDVAVFDVETGGLVRKFVRAHSGERLDARPPPTAAAATGASHRCRCCCAGELINISRFAHLSPNVFATSSLDRTIKLWDLRAPAAGGGVGGVGVARPLYAVASARQNVTLSFRQDDVLLLSAAADNEVR